MENNITKPISIVYEEFKNELKNLINNSGLPAFMLEPIIKDVYNKVKLAERTQLENDYKQYQEMIKTNNVENQ